MAISDLTKELKKDSFIIDSETQKKVVESLVTVLSTDPASEVQSCAIKW